MRLPELESEDLSNRIAVLELESEDLSNRIAVLELESEDLSNRIAVLASQGGSGWLIPRSSFASKVVVLLKRRSQFTSRHMCLPELESEDLSNRIAVL